MDTQTQQTPRQINAEYYLQLANEFGLPLYVYDADIMLRQYNKLVAAFAGTRVRINYACKALGNINVLKLFRSWGAGLDTVSIEEVQLGLLAGFAPNQIIFTPNCVSIAEISKAVDFGVHINIDNISILEQFGAKYGNSVPVCIRINPHIYAGGHHQIATGHIDSKFGISIYQMRHVERIVQSLGIRVEGLHMHTGSEIKDIAVFLNGAEILFDTARYFKDLQFVDFGSGFKVAYQPGDFSTDIAQLGQQLTERFNAFCADYGRDLALWFEPGKFLVSESCVFLAPLNVIKEIYFRLIIFRI